MKAINNISGTSLIGYVAVSYNRLVEVFGEPHFRGDKTTVEWAFEHDGEKFTIYNYKWASCQNDTIESFHIGGLSQRAVDLVTRFLINGPPPRDRRLFRINWTDTAGYYTDIEAETAQEAREAWERGEYDRCDPCGFCETNIIKVTPLDEKSGSST